MTQLKRFDPQAASEAEFESYAVFVNTLRAEYDPDDPPLPTEHIKRNMSNIPPSVHLHTWLIWEEASVIARSQFATQDREDNQHAGQANVEVIASRRRQGLAQDLLRPLLQQAKDAARTLLVGETISNVASGEAFMNRLGAKKGIAMHTNQLDLQDLDHVLMASWREAADTQNYELTVWKDRTPDEYLDAYARLKDVMNTAPFDELELEAFKITPELIREEEASLKARGQRKWVVASRHRSSGDLAGYTETYWSPSNPRVLNQGDTGVVAQHRGNRLGRWLKAAMLGEVLKDKPELQFIRTGNADSNDAMLKINHDMGFKPYKAVTVWQLETEALAAYLSQV